MMRKLSGRAILPALFAATLAFGVLPAVAQPRPAEQINSAAQSYPRTYGSGENIMVDYGPMGQAALVGGGRVMVSQTAGMDLTIVHLDAQFVQQPREGFVPLTVGSGETAETVWVPRAMVEMVRRARATAPAR